MTIFSKIYKLALNSRYSGIIFVLQAPNAMTDYINYSVAPIQLHVYAYMYMPIFHNPCCLYADPIQSNIVCVKYMCK